MRASAPHLFGVMLLGLVLTARASGEAVSGVRAAHDPVRPVPNIVLVMTDDQRWDSLWAMPTVREALQGHSVTFENAFVVNPLCCPSRASVLTGKYSHSTGVYLNQTPNGGFGSFDDSRTIATALDSAGYTTALIGKYLNGYGVDDKGARYVPPGWDRWVAFYGGNGYYDYRLSEQGHVVAYGHRSDDYSTGVLGRKAEAFVETARQPFFLEFTPYAPHGPATPPTRYEHTFENISWWRPPSFNEADLSDKPRHIRQLGPLTKSRLRVVNVYRRRQLAAALAVDDAVARIIRALEKRRILTRTIIVFTSDNGVAWGEHPLSAGRKSVPYEEPIRVPLVVRYDPMTQGHARIEARMALNIDLAPTFADLAGLTFDGADGRSLLPLLRREQGVSWRTSFLVEHLVEHLVGLPSRKIPTYCAVRTERYKYILHQTGEEELYDLRRDPHELTNRVEARPLVPLLRALRARLAVLCRPPPPGFTALETLREQP
jgi:arylsulfatase A-like enzyme